MQAEGRTYRTNPIMPDLFSYGLSVGYEQTCLQIYPYVSVEMDMDSLGLMGLGIQSSKNLVWLP